MSDLDLMAKAMKTLLETYVSYFDPADRSWVIPGLTVENDVSDANVSRVILGRKGYADFIFPSAYIDFKTMKWDTAGMKSEILIYQFRIIILTKDEPSHWGGIVKATEIVPLARLALYNTIGSHNTRTLLGTCNDCFAESAEIDTEPFGNAPDAVWSYFGFNARKRITA